MSIADLIYDQFQNGDHKKESGSHIIPIASTLGGYPAQVFLMIADPDDVEFPAHMIFNIFDANDNILFHAILAREGNLSKKRFRVVVRYMLKIMKALNFFPGGSSSGCGRYRLAPLY